MAAYVFPQALNVQSVFLPFRCFICTVHSPPCSFTPYHCNLKEGDNFLRGRHGQIPWTWLNDNSVDVGTIGNENEALRGVVSPICTRRFGRNGEGGKERGVQEREEKTGKVTAARNSESREGSKTSRRMRMVSHIDDTRWKGQRK